MQIPTIRTDKHIPTMKAVYPIMNLKVRGEPRDLEEIINKDMKYLMMSNIGV